MDERKLSVHSGQKNCSNDANGLTAVAEAYAVEIDSSLSKSWITLWTFYSSEPRISSSCETSVKPPASKASFEAVVIEAVDRGSSRIGCLSAVFRRSALE